MSETAERTAPLAPRPPAVAYCDYIADRIRAELMCPDPERILVGVGRVQFDLTDSGSFRSTKKTLIVEDRHGKQYRVTVEEAN